MIWSGDTTIPINPNNGNDKIHINIPDWIKEKPTPPFNPNPYPPQVWYNHEPEPIQTNTQDVQYNGDFRDVQTSFNDK